MTERRHLFHATRPDCGVQVLDAGQGLHAPTVAAVGRLLARQPGIAAVYSVGGANAAIRAAFEQAGRACRVFIGHDLDDDNLALLRKRQLSAVLHHDLHHDLHLACHLLMQHISQNVDLEENWDESGAALPSHLLQYFTLLHILLRVLSIR